MFISVIIFACIMLCSVPQIFAADWPMAGHDNQRTSFSADGPSTYNRGCGQHMFDEYIPSKSHVITADLDTNVTTTADNLVYISTAIGVYALRSVGLNNSQSDIVWFYATDQPVGHSVTVDKAANPPRVYIPVLDKTIHAVNALTGQRIWQTNRAGGGFLTNPLVANGLIYAGNRDGYLYAFRSIDGSMAWSFVTEPRSPVDFSPAISTDNQTIYFASHNSRAYAVNAVTGRQIAVSIQFQGHGFYSYWPVVNTYTNRVLFVRSTNYPETNWVDANQNEYFNRLLAAGTVPTTNTSFATDWMNIHPDQQTLHVLDPTTLAVREISPYMHWGDPNGNRYPPAIDNTGRIWAMSAWTTGITGFPSGRFMGWKPGENIFIPLPGLTTGHESYDEPEAIAIFGNAIWHGDGGDGADGGGVVSLTGTTSKSWWGNSLASLVGVWWTKWNLFRYGNGLVATDTSVTNTGTHGLQNPPVPLANRVYIHRSNSLICLEQ